MQTSQRCIQTLDAIQQIDGLQEVWSAVPRTIGAAVEHGHSHVCRDGIEPVQGSDHAAHNAGVGVRVAASQQRVLQS